ncbi:hypothetical protein HFP15_08685 [Amycolatopsis sp. K13G38]|uniref:VOC domain-containing protein n=1 Tax=Amycolatopsis acididurans TaxID=2724524 RepID=A0ABX1IZU6_9PSEU|nr:VOC family protein [Amycolatopsis acididurans]NKQ52954.1 hypothetical protein [Amycolatopsis acididurans]
MLTVTRHGHVNHYTSDYDAALAVHRRALGGEVFSEFGTPGSRNALSVVGSTCLQVFSPDAPDSPVASWIGRFGASWHSLEWTVADLAEAEEVVAARGFRVTDRMAGRYVFLHPKDLHGLCLELTAEHFPGDPREQPEWDPDVGAGGNLLGITGPATVVLAVTDAAAAGEFFAGLTGRDIAHDDTLGAARATTLDFGDHRLDCLADPGLGPRERLYALRLPVPDLASAAASLTASGVPATPLSTTEGPALVLDTAATQGARIEIVQRTR